MSEKEEIKRLKFEIDELKILKDAVYKERAMILALLTSIIPKYCRIVPHEGEDWEDDWRNIISVVITNNKQMTWHIHDSELEMFDHLENWDGKDERFKWDGHSYDEKYRRLKAYIAIVHKHQEL